MIQGPLFPTTGLYGVPGGNTNGFLFRGQEEFEEVLRLRDCVTQETDVLSDPIQVLLDVRKRVKDLGDEFLATQLLFSTAMT